MKLYLEPIQVEPPKGKPRRLRWRRRVYVVEEVIDFWISQTRWWRDEEKRIYLRLLTDGGTLEVFRSGVDWTMSRIAD
jgi:hypothetical protein